MTEPYDPVNDPRRALVAALCRVMLAVGGVKETGRNEKQNYRYASDTDLLRAVQPAMAAEGLALVPSEVRAETTRHSDTRGGAAQWRTDVLVTYLLLHSGGGSLTLQAPGSGVDGGDKGAYKAMTGALKYALRHALLIPTGDDAEIAPRDEDPEPPRTAPKRAAPKPSAPTPAPVQAPERTVPPPKGEHDPEWEADKARFFAAMAKIPGCSSYDIVSRVAHAEGLRPSQVGRAGRKALLEYLATADGQAEIAELLRERVPGEEG